MGRFIQGNSSNISLTPKFSSLFFKTPVFFKYKNFEFFKPLRKQLSNVEELAVYFRIMFYVANIHVLKQETTRYHYFLQIRNDVIDGVIPVNSDQSSTLASYAIQSQFLKNKKLYFYF